MYLIIPPFYLKWEIVFLPMTIRNGTELQENQLDRQKMVQKEGESSDLMIPGSYCI